MGDRGVRRDPGRDIPMIRWRALHAAAALAAVCALVAAIAATPGAWAITPPPINTAAVPPDTVGPEQPMRPSTICQTPVCSRQATSPTRRPRGGYSTSRQRGR
ncbi:peptidase S8 and S53, subtilisin, kexin, sedolisin domain protein [Mycobacterium xenopi 4042]|uniref:Peptidase S8 and S53, subtilisin, kexin, sedolisin domain protein n=1 Tax=Mycobacterium xenopi 4042 TaxID=1299334 RepID=X7YS52_MYCXE|nr:peptidase S8 and S53, subtilisin, kexin, sedolisin domain protein [Mycobacterium xenopi 4042]